MRVPAALPAYSLLVVYIDCDCQKVNLRIQFTVQFDKVVSLLMPPHHDESRQIEPVLC
jgi:hypothetical protein